MNGKDILTHIDANPSELQYWEIIARLMEIHLTRRTDTTLTHNIRNTTCTGINGIDETIQKLKDDGFNVEVVQNNTRPVQTHFGSVEVVEYTTIRLSINDLPSVRKMGSVTDPEYNDAIAIRYSGNAGTPILG